jgi:hypothetical protein
MTKAGTSAIEAIREVYKKYYTSDQIYKWIKEYSRPMTWLEPKALEEEKEKEFNEFGEVSP